MADAAAVRDRADRRVLPAGRARQGRAGRASRAAPASSEAVARFFDELRRAARGVTRARRRRWPTPRRRARAGVRGRSAPRRRAHAAAPTLRFDAARSTEPTRPRGLHDRAHARRSRSSRRSAATTPRRASGWSSSSARPSAGPRRPTSFVWAQVDVAGARASPARRRSRVPVPCTYDLEVAAAKYFYGARRTARCRCASTSTARSSTAATTAGCRSCSSRGAARPRYRLPVEVWREMIDAPLPGQRLGPRCSDDTLERAARATRRERGLPTFDAALARAARERGERRARASSSTRCSTRATRSTRTRRARPRTRRRRRSGSSTRPPTRRSADAPSTTCGSSACVEPAPRRELDGRGALPAGRAASATRRSSARELPRRARPSSPRRRGEFAFDARAAARRGCALRPSRSTTAARASRSASHNTHARSTGRHRPRRGAARSAALDAPGRCASRGGRFVSPLERRPRRCASVNTWPGARHAEDDVRARRRDRAARPPAARAREPRQPLRQHRDRGGAAAARAGAQRRRARGDRRSRTRRCAR